MFGTKQTSKDRQRINLDEDDEVRYWTQALGISEQELRTAVEFAGESADNVRDYLKRNHRALA